MVYYRPFQGANPSLHDLPLAFSSDFESGNLDAAVRLSEFEYDLFLRVDSNTRGHCFWYYFEVTNRRPDRLSLRFNLCNLSRSGSLYSRGMRPYLLRCGEWSQSHTTTLSYCRQPLRYPFIK